MNGSIIGKIMQRTFAKSVTGTSLVLDEQEDEEELWGPAHSFVSSPENSRAAAMSWRRAPENAKA